jgi:Asp/Glu/hydantoin racemase
VARTLALIHTSPTLTPLFGRLCSEYIPSANVFHMVDESLIKDTVREGHLRRVTIRRLLSMIESAEQAGADAVLVTCSSIGEGVEFGQKLFDIPVVRVDEAMARKAVRMGRKIGVMATLRTTLEPTVALLRAKAAEAGVQIDVVESLCEGAFEAVVSGDQATHDRILTAALKNEMKGVDVVVLAQASMAGVLKSLPAGTLSMPVLTSPELGVIAVKDVIEALDGHALVSASTNGQKVGR